MDKDKKEFVFKKGMLGVGLPVGLLMAVTAGFQVPGYLFKLQSFNFKTFSVALAIFTPVFLLAGYFWGIVVYQFSRNRK